MNRSSWGEVTRGLPLRGRSSVDPVSPNRVTSLRTVLSVTPKCLATSFGLLPPCNMPIALSRSILDRRGIVHRLKRIAFYAFFTFKNLACINAYTAFQFHTTHIDFSAKRVFSGPSIEMIKVIDKLTSK